MDNFIIYDHISPSGKHYIGQTCMPPERRWRNGNGYKQCPKFFNAILRYGWENFQHKILFSGLSQKDADLIETDLIFYYKKIGKSYNLDAGGGVGHRSDETKAKLAISNKGKTPWMKGKKQSEEHISKRMEPIKIAVLQYSLDGILIKKWDSAADAARGLGIKWGSHISACCLGNRRSCGGFKWVYA